MMEYMGIEVKESLRAEDIEKFDNNSHIFYRWQVPSWEISGEYTESWEMCYSSAEEAREAYEDMELDAEDAVLPGKSCMPTFREILSCDNAAFPTCILLVFEGSDTYVTGHDGEYVAEFGTLLTAYTYDCAYDFPMALVS